MCNHYVFTCPILIIRCFIRKKDNSKPLKNSEKKYNEKCASAKNMQERKKQFKEKNI